MTILVRGVALAAAGGSLAALARHPSAGSGLLVTAVVAMGTALAARSAMQGAGFLLGVGARRVAAPVGPFGAASFLHNPRRTALTVATLGVGLGCVVWFWTWVLELHLPYWELPVLAALTLAVGGVAGTLPARRAGRSSPAWRSGRSRTMENGITVALEGVSKHYGGGPEPVAAVCEVSLRILAGEFVGILGPSGSGKSTLLNLIAGLDSPTAGRVLVGGRDLAYLGDNARSDLRLREIGFVSQSFNLLPTFTAEENVAWPLEFLGVRWREARRRAEAALAQVGLPRAVARRRPAQLSGGEQQRVAVARALVTEPQLLLADEPTGNLDSQTGQTILDLLRRLNAERHLTVVLVTHNALAASHAQRTVELQDGRIVRELRGTITIMFTDIVGFSAMTEQLGDVRVQDILHTHCAIVREQIAVHGGFEVKTQGDGFMIAFATARHGLGCAVAIQRAIAAYDEHAEAPVRLRIGLHTGEATKEGCDFFGRNVIVAARIAAAARGGEILVSSLVRELTGGAEEFAFDGGRELELKGLSGRQRVFAVEWEQGRDPARAHVHGKPGNGAGQPHPAPSFLHLAARYG